MDNNNNTEIQEKIDYKTEYEQISDDYNYLYHEYELIQQKFLFSERRYNQLEEQYNILFKVIDELLKKGESN